MSGSTVDGDRGGNARTPRHAGPDYIQSLARGIEVIRSFENAERPLSLTEIATRSNLTRATARRFLLTLATLGYVRNDATGFSLTSRVLDIGYSYLSSAAVPRLAEQRLEALVLRTRESASLSVLDGDSIVYVARSSVARIMAIGVTIGSRFPAFCTSMGRVLLAGMGDAELDDFLSRYPRTARTQFTVTDPDELRRRIDRVRHDGWSLVDQELEAGLTSLAVPVRDRAGTVIAAMNTSLSSRKYSRTEVKQQLLPELLATARSLEDDLSRLSPGTLR